MRSVKQNFIWNTLYQMVRIAIPLVTTPYLTRMLGSESLGVYSYTYTVATYFTYFVLLGLNQYGNREVSKVRDDKAKLSQTFWSIYLGQLVMGSLVTFIYLIYALSLPGILGVCTLIWSLWIFAEVGDIGWLYYGLEEFKLITIRNLVIRVAVVMGIFLLVKSPDDLWIYCVLQAFSFLSNSVVLWALIGQRVSWYKPRLAEILGHIKPSLILFAPVIAISLYTQLNKILLGNLADMHQVAFYDNADKITTIPLTLIQSIGTVLLPRMSNILAKGNKERAIGYVSQSFWLSMLLAFGLFFGIGGVAPEFVPVFFGKGFEDCITLMPILALIIPFVAASSTFGNQFLIPFERDKQYLFSVLMGAAANILTCLALIPHFGALGAAIATVFAEAMVTFVQVIFVRSQLPLTEFIKKIAPYFAFGLIEYACIRLTSLLPLEGVLRLFMEILVGLITYGALTFILLMIKKDEKLRLFGLGRLLDK